MANYTEEQWNAIKIEIMEKCYNSFAQLGLHGTGMREMAKYCGYNTSKIYTYFKDLDDLIIQSTEYCMSKVEDEFMAKAPTDVEDLWRFIDEIPYWTAEKHGKKYRLMYQVYTHPKYREYGILSLIIVVVVQMVENNILQPIVMSKTTELHPVTIIVGLLLFEHFFGIVGMILCTPCMSLVKVVWRFFK